MSQGLPTENVFVCLSNFLFKICTRLPEVKLCLWDSLPTRKLQGLGIGKQYSFFGKDDSIKPTKEQHKCNCGRTV